MVVSPNGLNSTQLPLGNSLPLSVRKKSSFVFKSSFHSDFRIHLNQSTNSSALYAVVLQGVVVRLTSVGKFVKLMTFESNGAGIVGG